MIEKCQESQSEGSDAIPDENTNPASMILNTQETKMIEDLESQHRSVVNDEELESQNTKQAHREKHKISKEVCMQILDQCQPSFHLEGLDLNFNNQYQITNAMKKSPNTL